MKEVQPGLVGGEPVIGHFFLSFCFGLCSLFVVLPVAAPPGGHDSDATSSLYRITELLSRIKHGNRGIFHDTTLSLVDHLFPQKEKMPDLFRTKLILIGVGSGLGLGLGL